MHKRTPTAPHAQSIGLFHRRVDTAVETVVFRHSDMPAGPLPAIVIAQILPGTESVRFSRNRNCKLLFFREHRVRVDAGLGCSEFPTTTVPWCAAPDGSTEPITTL